jgi:hypothetical protein
MKDHLSGMWKNMTTVFKILSCHMPKMTVRNQRNISQDYQPLTGIQTESSQAWGRCAFIMFNLIQFNSILLVTKLAL